MRAYAIGPGLWSMIFVIAALPTGTASAQALGAGKAGLPQVVCAQTGRLSIDGTPKTPTILFDAQTGILMLKGRSIPENSIEFYRPLRIALEAYARQPAPRTLVQIQLEGFDSDSEKALFEVFHRLEALHERGASDVVVNWHYEEDDEDMRAAGEDYQAIINVPFRMAEIHPDPAAPKGGDSPVKTGPGVVISYDPTLGLGTYWDDETGEQRVFKTIRPGADIRPGDSVTVNVTTSTGKAIVSRSQVTAEKSVSTS